MATQEQVYEEVGRALEAACILETALGTSLLTLDGLATESYINPDADAYMRLRNAMEKKTLGQSLDAMKRQLPLPDDMEKTFTDALAARNFLAHRFFPYHGLAVLDPAGCDSMLAHAKELRSTLLHVSKLANSLSESLMVLFRRAVSSARSQSLPV
jgi:hypothetical protein